MASSSSSSSSSLYYLSSFSLRGNSVLLCVNLSKTKTDQWDGAMANRDGTWTLFFLSQLFLPTTRNNTI